MKVLSTTSRMLFLAATAATFRMSVSLSVGLVGDSIQINCTYVEAETNEPTMLS